MMLREISMTILGNTPSKSNQYRIARGRMYKSKQLKQYEDLFLIQCQQYRDLLIDQEFGIKLEVYYPSRRTDLDNSLKVILDCCQKAKIIKNDNKCVRIEADKFIDKENPRINILIYEI